MKTYRVANKLTINYTGVVSTQSVQSGKESPWNELLELVSIPEGWSVNASHMTMNLSKAKHPDLLGKTTQLTVIAIGKNENVIAVLVDSPVPTENEHSHVTVAVAPDARPQMSNNITEWKPIKHITLKGVVSEVTDEGLIVTEKMRLAHDALIEKEQAEKIRIQEEKKRKREEENEELRALGFEGAKEFLQRQFPHLPEQAILGKLKGAGLI